MPKKAVKTETSKELVRVTPTPAVSLEEMKAHADHVFGGRDGLLARSGKFDALEVFGQSSSFREGFARQGLQCQSFDVSHLG